MEATHPKTRAVNQSSTYCSPVATSSLSDPLPLQSLPERSLSTPDVPLLSREDSSCSHSLLRALLLVSEVDVHRVMPTTGSDLDELGTTTNFPFSLLLLNLPFFLTADCGASPSDSLREPPSPHYCPLLSAADVQDRKLARGSSEEFGAVCSASATITLDSRGER